MSTHLDATINAEWLVACGGQRDRSNEYRWSLASAGGNGELIYNLRDGEVTAEYWDDYEKSRVLLARYSQKQQFAMLLLSLGLLSAAPAIVGVRDEATLEKYREWLQLDPLSEKPPSGKPGEPT